jgi:hypothetical protein
MLMKLAIWRSKWFVPALAIAAGFAAAGLHVGHAADGQTGSAVPSTVVAPPASGAPEEGLELQGRVLETITVPNYTYLRLKTGETTEAWAAVPTASVSVGSQVRVRNAAMMSAFSSPTLHRVFDTIYFGTLDGAGAAAAGHGHPTGQEAAGPHAALGGPENSAGFHDPKRGGPAADQPIKVGKVKPAEGPSGVTVSALRAKRQQFAGKSVRVRGVVVKAVPGVLDRTFVHVRDGSGRADGVDDDLTLTTTTTPETGSTMLFEGVVAADRDFGSGYKYDVILETARVVSD